MNKVTVTAKTVDDAVSMALKQLSAAQDQVTVTILEEPSKGFLGLIGVKPAKVEVEIKIDPLAEAQKFLEMVLENMKISAKVVVTKKSDFYLFDIVGDDLGIIIGRRGQTLESLQFLVNTVGNRHSNSYLRIILDAENYREKRKQTLQQLADRLAEKAAKSGQPVKLEPMSAHERKIIHTHLQGKSLVMTYSEGTDPNRYIVIQAKK
ncbi:RNA-binding cell elongation regulator Jag/EloR [Ammoniphilus resinae]|uniref:RNA-binding protein KhpB n=1 Tax=Ammoniphilus resinae TaxID=861532 RepID=A0ABS4GPZ8_9BACL|nr:spoIIIJ-associated protein [Ammoniphilus resinae]